MAQITTLSGTALKVCDRRPVFEMRNRPVIDAWWLAQSTANPRWWNGPFYLFENLSIENGVLKGDACRTDFATFLFWRDHGRDPECSHVTGTSFAITADNVVLAMRMGAHTANAGFTYFPAGSFDEADILDGHLNPEVNILREFREETGIETTPQTFDTPWLHFADNRVHQVTRRMRLPLTFDECVARWRAHVAAGGDDEIEALVPLTRASHSVDRMKPYARAFAAWHFTNGDDV